MKYALPIYHNYIIMEFAAISNAWEGKEGCKGFGSSLMYNYVTKIFIILKRCTYLISKLYWPFTMKD